MPKPSSLLNKPAPPITLPRIPDGQPYTLPIGEKVRSGRHTTVFPTGPSRGISLTVQPIAIFFFPAAGTMGCTMQACAFRDAKASNAVFQRHPDLEVVGISPAKQASFADQHHLPYPLLSDAQGDARRAYNLGRAFFGTTDARETFFIDTKGVLVGHHEANLGFASHATFVENQLKAMEARDKSSGQ